MPGATNGGLFVDICLELESWDRTSMKLKSLFNYLIINYFSRLVVYVLILCIQTKVRSFLHLVKLTKRLTMEFSPVIGRSPG